jgi:hypothetical protein
VNQVSDKAFHCTKLFEKKNNNIKKSAVIIYLRGYTLGLLNLPVIGVLSKFVEKEHLGIFSVIDSGIIKMRDEV